MKQITETFVVSLTQFMAPSGSRKTVETDLPITSKADYESMKEHGCHLECEVLGTGEVHITVSDGEDDLDSSVTKNGPQVQAGMVDMLGRRAWLRSSEDDTWRPHCPDCGSARVTADGDVVEPLMHPDRGVPDAVFYPWWHCDECGNDWRYQDEKLNP